MDIAELGLSVRSDGVVVASDRLNRFGRDADRAEKATNRLADTFRRFAPLVGTVMAAFSGRALKDYADAWSDMQSRVGAAVKNMEAAPALMERIVDIANASYSPLSQTVEIFGRNVATLRDLGRSATDAADFTEALNHALVTTATKGQDADIVLNSLSRAISNGKMRTMEFETIMSRSPRVLEAIADHLNTNVTGLRALAAQGKVTGDAMATGIIKSLEVLRKEAGEMPATIGDATVRIGTNFQALVGRIDQATGSSENFALQLIGLADAIRAGTDDIVRAALVIQTGFNATLEWASVAVNALAGDFDMASGLIVAGAGAAGFAVTALTAAITMGLLKALAALSLALIANPFALFIGGIAAAVTASYLFRDEIAKLVGVDVFDVFKQTGNLIIGVMVGAYDAVIAAWKHLPGEFGKLGKLAANALLDALGSIELSWTNPFTGATYELFNFDLSDLKFKLNETESYTDAVAAAAYRAAQGIDYIGNASGALRTVWENADGAAAAFKDLAENANMPMTPFDPKAAKEAEKLAKAYRQIVDGAQDFVRSQQLEAGLIGMSEQAANALRYEFDLLNEARRAGIDLTDADKAGFKALAEAMAEAEAHTKRLREQFDFLKDVTKGIFIDIKNDLISNMQQGMSFWESAWRAMANAALNALNKIVDKLLNEVIDAIFQVGNAGSGGGLFGWISNLFGGGGLLGGGGFTPGLPFPAAPGGGFHTLASASLMPGVAASTMGALDRVAAGVGRALPAANINRVAQPYMPAQRAYGGGGAAVAQQPSQPQTVEITVNIDGARGDQHIVDLVREGVRIGITQYDREAGPAMVHRVVRDPRARG